MSNDIPTSPAGAQSAVARVIERLLHSWFLVSLLLVTAFAGWSLARYGLQWAGIAALAAQLLWIPIIARRRIAVALSGAGAVAVVFGLGVTAATTNSYQINDWMDNSATLLSTAITPVQTFEEGEGVVVMPEDQQRTLQAMAKSSLQIHDHGLDQKILVSFESGLAIVDHQDVQFLLPGGYMSLLPTMSPGKPLLYYNGWYDEWQPGQVPMLTRATLRDGALHRIWEVPTAELVLHHWGDEFDGKIYLPGRNFESLPNETSQRIGHTYAGCRTDNARSDVIRILDAETGRLERSIDLLPLIAELAATEAGPAAAIDNCDDSLHLNDVQIVKTEKHARYFPGGKVGDMLVSTRNNNTIMLLDRDTSALKWSVTDLTDMQHSPRISDRGTLIVFDNRGSDAAGGRSRIAEIDIASRTLAGFWEGNRDDPFENLKGGKVNIVGDKIVVQDQDPDKSGHTLFMLDCPGGRLSPTCEKTRIFTSTSKDFKFYNAVFY